nr:hypothetical protein [Streptomyces sp. S1D4-11]QIY92936.1 hypothetical protein HEP87_52970 [Streptomyces sp. S1D4-11]
MAALVGDAGAVTGAAALVRAVGQLRHAVLLVSPGPPRARRLGVSPAATTAPCCPAGRWSACLDPQPPQALRMPRMPQMP